MPIARQRQRAGFGYCNREITEQPVILDHVGPGNAGRKEQLVGGPACAAISEKQPP